MNVYEQVTENIVSMLEQGDVPQWRKSWTGEPLSIPHNGVTGHQYRGINVWNLLMTAWAKHYGSSQWATYKQWQDKGGQVRKGEKSTIAVFFKPLEKIDDSGKEYMLHIARAFHVFNKDQVDIELPSEPTQELTRDDIELAGISIELASSLGVSVNEGSPSYNPMLDSINMPKFSSFTDGGAYFSTMAHECSHATGHQSRLDRKFGKRFGDDAYAMEELVAELSAAYICAKYGTGYHIEQHASYLSSWLKRLREDNKAIFTVAAAAQRAADHISDSVESFRLEQQQESELGRLIA